MKDKIKDKLNDVYDYLGHKKGITVRAVYWVGGAYVMPNYGMESVFQWIIFGLVTESFYNTVRKKESVTPDG